MSFCSKCGENNGDSNFCSVCGEKNLKQDFSNLQSKEDKNSIEFRDIEKYINHLKKLVESESSLIIEEDLIKYQKTLLSLSEEKFRNLNFIKFLGLKKVKDINSFLEIDQKFTDQQIGRFYRNNKKSEFEKKDSKDQKRKWYKKWWGILIILWVLGIFIRVFFPGPNGCDCIKLSSKKSMGLYYDVEKYNSCIKKFGTSKEMQRQCIIGDK